MSTAPISCVCGLLLRITMQISVSPRTSLKQLSEVYRKIRNTARYILGNLFDFNPDTDQVAV